MPCSSHSYLRWFLALLMTHSFSSVRSSQTMVFIRVCNAGSSASLCALITALWLLMEFSEKATLHSFISFLPARLVSVEDFTNKNRRVLCSCRLWCQWLISPTKKQLPMGQHWTQPQDHTAPCLQDFITAIIPWVCIPRPPVKVIACIYTSKVTSKVMQLHLITK